MTELKLSYGNLHTIFDHNPAGVSRDVKIQLNDIFDKNDRFYFVRGEQNT